MTLEQAVRVMLSFEPELNAAEYDTLSSIEDIKVTRSARLPQASLRGSTGVSNRDRSTDGLFRSGDTVWQRQLGLSIRQLIFDGGVSRNQVQASENAMLAQQYLEKAMVEARVVDLSEVYLEVLRTTEQIKLAQKNVANHEKTVSQMQTKMKHQGERTELKLASSRLERSRSTLSALQLESRRSQSRLGRLIGNYDFVLTYPVIPMIPQNREDISLDSNWDYLAATEALEEAEHLAKAEKSRYAPKFYLDAGYSVGQNVSGIPGSDNEANALIVGEWTLFDGGRRKALKQRNHFQVGKFEELKRAADLARHYDLDLLWQERLANEHSIGILSSYANELDEVVKDYQKRFGLGKETLLNILDIQNEHYGISKELLDARYDFDASTFRIMGKQGKLAEWLLRDLENSLLNRFEAASKNPAEDAIPVVLSTGDELKDERVPLTQKELMKRVFDREGPTANYEPAPMEEYYETETNSRKGWFQRSFSGRKKSREKASPSVSVKPSSRRLYGRNRN